MAKSAAFAALIAAASLAGGASLAQAQDTKVAIGISGWTGFAPLTLAKEAGIYKANGLDVSIKKIPQKDRHLAIASGDLQCAATTVETWIVWNTNGIATTQLFKMDQGMGSDGIVARNDITKVADLKGKTVAASAPGTNPHFTLAWILKKNGMSLKDVKLVTLEPAPTILVPSSRISPVVGVSSPATSRSRVDLPQPDGPSTVMKSLSATSSLTGSSACVGGVSRLWPGKILETSRIESWLTSTDSMRRAAGSPS